MTSKVTKDEKGKVTLNGLNSNRNREVGQEIASFPTTRISMKDNNPDNDRHAQNNTMSSSHYSNESEEEQAAAIPPSVVTRQRSTPGAISVPGIGLTGSFDYDQHQHDNLLDMEEAKENDSRYGSNYLMRTPTGRDRSAATSRTNPPSDGTMTTDLSIPIVAELVTSQSQQYSEEDIEERLAERLEAQISERLRHGVQQEIDRRLSQDFQRQHGIQQEVDRRLSQDFHQRQHAIAQVVTTNNENNNYTYTDTDNTNKRPNNKNEEEEKNFKLCGIRRTCWGMILCVIVLFVIGGVAGTFLWFYRAREEEKNKITESPTSVSSSFDSSFSPSPMESSMPSSSSTNTTKVPIDMISNAPSATPSTSSLIDRRWEYLITNIGPYIVPDDFVDDPEKYFVTDTDDVRYAALDWIATLDLETDVFNMPIQLLVERYVLVVLYYSTGGSQAWNENISFLSSKDVCNWNNDNSNPEKMIITDDNITDSKSDITNKEDNDYITVKRGVFCDSTGSRVTIIKLPNNSLQGEIPWELSLLEYLIQIDFDSNQLYGSIPTDLGRLSRLQALWLKDNDITGTLPFEFTNATKLESLDLEGNSLASTLPPEWGSLSNLFYISLRLNNITGTLPPEWQGLISLKILDLDGNQLEGTLPEEYEELSELTSLYFESNRFEGTLPSSWGNLTNLENFFVDDNILSGSVPDEYSALMNLKYFWFHGNMLTGSVDETFCNYPLSDNSTNMRSNCLSNDLAGLPAQIECSCCTTCCDRNGADCVANIL
jgi:Leucine-rich repeat (LRR) protein